MAKKCPLCGGKLKNNYCESCGYAVPDDDELSALYNLDPTDYPEPQEQPAVREITPDTQAEEIYPNRPEPPRFKVRNNEGKTVQNPNPYRQIPPQSANPYQQQNGGQYQQNSGGQYNSPYANPTPPSPYANTGNTSGANRNNLFSKELIKEFASKYWWYLLLILCLPFIISLILTTTLFSNRTLNKKYLPIAIAALFLSLILPPY